jgi:hypothetical protein
MRDMGLVGTETAACVPTRQTLRQRLEERKKAAEEHLEDVTKALEFLDKNPAFELFHNLVGKAGF